MKKAQQPILSKNQRSALGRIKVSAFATLGATEAALERGFYSGVRSEREQNAKLIEGAKFGTPDQRKGLAALIRLGRNDKVDQLRGH